MRTLTVVDLLVYFLVGLLIILFAGGMRRAKSTVVDEQREEPPAEHAVVIVLAIIVGILACVCRYYVGNIGKDDAMNQLSATFENTNGNIIAL